MQRHHTNIISKVYHSRFFPLLVFVLVGLLVLSKVIWNHSLILGHDSLFHFNRFVDAEEQLRTGKFSYFQMNFGFNQTGRIVNALYGPFVAYISGALLLISPNWYIFELIDVMVVMLVAAFGMYWLCKVNQVSRGYALIVASMYMIGSSVISWVNTQQFTGVGAAVIPYLFVAIALTLRRLKVPVIGLSIAMAILVQTHMITSMMGFLALVPIFTVALVKTEDKLKMVVSSFGAALITLALTANVWGALLSIFTNNHLIPAFSTVDMSNYGFVFNLYSFEMIIKPMELIVFIYVIAYVLIKWRSLDYIIKTYALVGGFFLWVSTNLFPWKILQSLIPELSTYLQFPKRFAVLAFVLLFVSFGMILTNDHDALTLKWLHFEGPDYRYAFIFLLMATMIGTNIWVLNFKIATVDSMRQSNDFQIPIEHTVSHVNRNKRTYYEDFYGSNKKALVDDLSKVVPDYLPATQKVNYKNYNDYHPYSNAYQQLDKQNYRIKGGFKKTVNKDGSLTITWNNRHKKARNYQIPVVAYASTELTLNGKTVIPVSQTPVGAVVIKANPGKNSLNVSYHIGWAMKVLFILTIVSWIVIIGIAIIRIWI
ncbi:MAG: hypothetical protein M3Z82_01345 [Apilactobacillus sp.]|uniref:hypothetical protein n=1 Tax=Apilactobacillus apinorum TaxID=1218495 RepID=UPI003340A1AA|nr:hypothetical protein [Apilactobacillus sp.]